MYYLYQLHMWLILGDYSCHCVKEPQFSNHKNINFHIRVNKDTHVFVEYHNKIVFIQPFLWDPVSKVSLHINS